MNHAPEEINYIKNHELTLGELINSILIKKNLIASLTGFITILGLLYALSITPNYQVNTSFISASNSSITKINNGIYVDEMKESVLSSFLIQLMSQDLQKEVFIENDFLTIFNKNNIPIDSIDSYVSGVLESVKLNLPDPSKVDDYQYYNYLPELDYQLTMQGEDPKAIAKLLNLLVEEANSKTIAALLAENNFNKSNYLKKLSLEKKILLNQANQARLNQIVILTETGEIAKSLGVIENNFDMIYNSKVKADLTISIGDNLLPEWYLYGEEGILKKIELLKNRTNNGPYIPELVALNSQINQIELSNSDLDNVSMMQVNLISMPLTSPVNFNSQIFVLLAFVGSFLMSILLSLIIISLEPEEKTPT